VRILHFGDSHVAADFWSGEIRRRLQERFGDGGVGQVMPGRPWKNFRHSGAKSLDGDGWRTTGLKEAPTDGVLGLSGTALFPEKDTPASALAPGRDFEVTLATESDSVPVRILVDGRPFDAVSRKVRWINSGGSDVALLTISSREPFSGDGAPRKLSVLASPGSGTRLLGADFTSGKSGVILDSLGVNGARMTALEKWSPRMRKLLLDRARPSLAIVSYGTNEIGAKDFTYEGFRADCVRVLKGLKADLGETPVLVTGPIDRAAVRKDGSRIPMTEAERPVVRAIREAAAETGCAFWDARAAMGGDGSMLAWMQAGLAQADGSHLTQEGYERQGRMLADRLISSWEEHRGRKKPPADEAAR
jgi:lysophospholipase L1-like esterase